MALARVSEAHLSLGLSPQPSKAPYGLSWLLPVLRQHFPQIFQNKNYRTDPKQAASLNALLSFEARAQLEQILGVGQVIELASLCHETKDSIAHGDALRFADGLPSEHLELQLSLYEAVEATEGKTAALASERLTVAKGGGSFAQRLTHNLKHFQEHAMSPAMVGGLATGMWLGAAARYGILSGLRGARGVWSSSALGGQAVARAGAFAVEVPGVVTASKLIRSRNAPQDWSLSTLAQESARMGVSLFVIKGVTGAAHRGLALSGQSAVAKSLLGGVGRAALPHAATGVGIYLAKPAERAVFGDLGLGVGSSWVDAGFEALSFGIAGGLTKALTPRSVQHRLQNWQQESYALERGLGRHFLQSPRRALASLHFSQRALVAANVGRIPGLNAKGDNVMMMAEGGGGDSRVPKTFRRSGSRGVGGIRPSSEPPGKPVLSGDQIKRLPKKLPFGDLLSLRDRLGLNPDSSRWETVLDDIVETHFPYRALWSNYRTLMTRLPWAETTFSVGEATLTPGQAARRVAFFHRHVGKVNPLQTGFGTPFDAMFQMASLEVISSMDVALFTKWAQLVVKAPSLTQVENFMAEEGLLKAPKIVEQRSNTPLHRSLDINDLPEVYQRRVKRLNLNNDIGKKAAVQNLLARYLLRLDPRVHRGPFVFRPEVRGLRYQHPEDRAFGRGPHHLAMSADHALSAYEAFQTEVVPGQRQGALPVKELQNALMAAVDSKMPELRIAAITRALLLRDPQAPEITRTQLQVWAEPEKPVWLGSVASARGVMELEKQLARDASLPQVAQDRWNSFQEAVVEVWKPGEHLTTEAIVTLVDRFTNHQGLGFKTGEIHQATTLGAGESVLVDVEFGNDTLLKKYRPSIRGHLLGLLIPARSRISANRNKVYSRPLILLRRFSSPPTTLAEALRQAVTYSQTLVHEFRHLKQGEGEGNLSEGAARHHHYRNDWEVIRELGPVLGEQAFDHLVGNVKDLKIAAQHPDGLMGYNLGRIQADHAPVPPLAIKSSTGERFFTDEAASSSPTKLIARSQQ